MSCTNPKIFNFSFKELNISKNEVISSILGGEEDESQQYYVDILEPEFLQLNDYVGIQGGYIETDDIAFDAINKSVRVLSKEFSVEISSSMSLNLQRKSLFLPALLESKSVTMPRKSIKLML